jgi:hypothetical protein
LASRVRESVARASAAVARIRAELLLAAALLTGWALVTLGTARLTHAPATVWAFSGGLLCLSLGGWRLAYTVARDGLYVLTRGPRDG